MCEEKWCIFHVPNYIDFNAKSGSQVRPLKMIEAFRSIGYNVDVVMGYGKERKAEIERIKADIKSGKNYDFLYSESSTMPTLLTEKSHFPLFPTLDFGFFSFCKKYNIKIGLFYRDIYWKFDIYKKKVPFIKRCISVFMFKYDLKKYDELVDVLYLPSGKMRPYVPVVNKYEMLPPGCDVSKEMVQYKSEQHNNQSGVLNLFYVGGIGDMYDLTDLFTVVTALKFVRLTVCCRQKEWQEMKSYYQRFMGDNISIVHKAGEELNIYYKQADIAMLFFDSSGYREFAMPIKLFEYISKMTPVITTQNSAAGEFVEKNGVGWNIPYQKEALESLLKEIYNNRSLLEEKKEQLKVILKSNSWEARARQVSKDLTIK